MASEQENRIVAEVMDNMKMAETEESSARRYVRRAVDKILIYCCREDLPERLEGTAAQIAEDMLKADLLVSTGKETSSVTRGDTTISYRDPSASRSATVDFMKNYETCEIHKTAGYTEETVKSQIQTDVQAHFLEIAFQSGVISLNFFKVSNIISAVSGVSEVVDLTINGKKDSITADYNKFFSLKGVIISVTE